MLLFLLLLVTVSNAVALGHDNEDSEVPRSTSEGDIIQELLHHRGDVKHGIPKSDTPLIVRITLLLHTVTRVNPDDGYVEVSGYVKQTWKDPRLRFRYGPPFQTVPQVMLSPQDVWMPDIELYEVAPPGVKVLSIGKHVLVDYNGTVRYFPFVSLPVFCDPAPNPHNTTTSFYCMLKFGSWSYDLVYLDVVDHRDFDLFLTYRPRGQWVVTSITGQRNQVTLPSLNKTYSDVTYYLTVTKATEEREGGSDD
ncbi:neuronal acetylcholine receptor subunit alpha-3-like isoform X2 [Babylonia areolata]|uniref:neuronal acetylcholine receptor subunit alpha-3-like isoform X2 n=1 Tax=Babylonia areolata TaxID=304850 RepID=UPI003FCF12B9